jgi:DNA-binding NarL/FixJ family response regulator
VDDALDLVAAVEKERPDVCFVDVRMPPTFTDEALRGALEIRDRWPGTPVLVLSEYVEERYATELLAGDSSAVGYLLKQRVADSAIPRRARARGARRDRTRPRSGSGS